MQLLCRSIPLLQVRQLPQRPPHADLWSLAATRRLGPGCEQEPALFLGLFYSKAGTTTERRPVPQGEALSLSLAATYDFVWSSRALGDVSAPQKGRMLTLKPVLA